MEPSKATSVNSRAEELFVQLFCEAFGPEKTENLQVQYPCVDIYGRHRYIDFALESPESKIAIEIDGETYHNPSKVSENKYADDLLKQNSLIYDNWKVYRWIYSQLEKQPEKVKDELITFLGSSPMFKAFEANLPVQMGQTIELRDYQQEATENLQKMREDGKTIALLYHATGIGKTITAATDAKAVGGRTLFLVNALKLASQAKETFAKVWPEATLGEYTGSQKDMTQTVIFATVQSISKDLEKFSPTDFDYLIVDECHHAAANTYQKIFTYFHPKFILGLTATPERSDGEDMLELFQNVAHKMDLKTAVERGVLVPIRCIRVKTNIDLTDVRINGIKYNSQDLESKLFIPERNQLIVDTYLKYVNGKKTVIFCASVDHAAEIAKLLRDNGVKAEAVSGRDCVEVREKILKDYETGSTNVLCACDLLNEGWDSRIPRCCSWHDRLCPKQSIYSSLAVAHAAARAKRICWWLTLWTTPICSICLTACTGCWTLQNISLWRMCWRRRTSASWIRICCSRAKSRRHGWMCQSMCPTMRLSTFSTGRTASRI